MLQSSHSASSQQLWRIFQSWKQALQTKRHGVPQILGILLAGVYLTRNTSSNLQLGQVPTVSSLQEPDRSLLARMTPHAKAYGFDIYLGQISYVQRGLLDTRGVDPETSDAYLEGNPDDAKFTDHWDDGYGEELDIESVISLDGEPMKLKSRSLMQYGATELEEYVIVNGTLTDGPKENIIEEWNAYDGGPYLARTWSRGVMFIIPNDSIDVRVEGSPDNISRMQSELELSTSTVPSTREERMVESLVRELERKESVAAVQSSFKPDATCLVKVAYRWKDEVLWKRVVRACGPCVIAILGVEQLVAGYRVFRKSTIKDMFAQVIETEISPTELRLDLLRLLRGKATAAGDNDLVSWCKDRLESGIRKTHRIRDEVLVRLSPVTRSDMGICHRKTNYCLDKIAPELPLYTARARSLASDSPSESEAAYVVAFVDMCLRFHSAKPLHVFFMRLENNLDSQEKRQNRVAGPTYSNLIKALRTTINAKPELKAHKLLGPFFDHAVQAMLPDHLPCASSEPEHPLLVAYRHLDDPVKTFHEWLTQEQNKAPEGRRDVIRTARNFTTIFRTQDMPQDRLDKCISTLMPFVEERVKDLGAESLSNTHTRQSVLDVIELCVAIQASTSQFSGLLSNKVFEEGGKTSVKYIVDGLVPFLRDLQTLLQRNNLTLVDKPYSSFAAGVIKQIITHVLKNPQILRKYWRSLAADAAPSA
ncbi:hypothetical protein PQX77_008618 [Marasmius sp. AFHP31]|nr:hypothetical protein PQX77_008618 [Marasmius sp. AFHP31]